MTNLQKFLIDNPDVTVEIGVSGTQEKILIYEFFNQKRQAPYPYQIELKPETDLEKCEEEILSHYSSRY